MSYPVDTNVIPEVEAFFDEPTNTISYIVKDPRSDACAILDRVMDLDYAVGWIATRDGHLRPYRADPARSEARKKKE